MSPYDAVADEYYIPTRHPTCDNFRTASTIIVAHWLPRVPRGGTICEIGSGKSIVAEQQAQSGRPIDRLLITDQSARMLRYSLHFAGMGAKLILADAEYLPLRAGAIDCMVASLGDPYNGKAFWAEAFRVLRPGGEIIFTVPSHDWAQFFRRGALNAKPTEAEFELADGRHVFLPSFICARARQQAVIEKAGLAVVETREVTIGDLRGQKLSPKLGLDRGLEASVVTGYLVLKAGSRTGQAQ